MKQETWIQIISLIILGIVTIFYDPRSADFEGKLIFFGSIITVILFFVLLDLYSKIENNNIKIRIFNEKLGLLERIKNLENFKENIENEKK
jgi:hypothetical protein